MNPGNDLPTMTNEQVFTVRGKIIYVAVIMCFFLLVEAIILVFIKPQQHSNGFILIVPLIVGLAVILYTVRMRGMRLITGDEGMIYVTQGYRLYTPWNNLLERTIWGGRSAVEAVRLNMAAQEMSISNGMSRRQPAFERKGRGIYDVNLASKVIPVGYFMSSWQDSPVGNAIRDHAPQVFAQRLPTRFTQV